MQTIRVHYALPAGFSEHNANHVAQVHDQDMKASKIAGKPLGDRGVHYVHGFRWLDFVYETHAEAEKKRAELTIAGFTPDPPIVGETVTLSPELKGSK